MPKLIDILTFKESRSVHAAPDLSRDDRLRRDERDAAVLTDKYPVDAVEFEAAREFRLASLMQYPHF